MLNLFSMMGNYEDRKVDRFENDLFIVDTALVTDRGLSYETAIAHKDFNGGEWIVLGWRSTKEEAQKFHDEMVEHFLTNGDTILSVKDVFDNVVYTRKEKSDADSKE